MTTERAPGFTLLELLLAVALTSLVAVSAVAALGLFAEADQRTIGGTETGVDVTRALQQLRRDVEGAATIDLGSQQWTFAQTDGTTVVWALAAGDTALHRFAGSDLAALLVPVQVVLTAPATAPQYDGRGRLREASYSASAMVQGELTVQIAPLTSPIDGAEIGVRVAIGHAALSGRTTQTCTVCSLALVEAHCKP
ncbi:MAG: prepilin-type N-terminal cleavage/methylation domain-containing protein [Planctomycetota bacterium]